MAYRVSYNKKEIRSCDTCHKKADEMVYVREKISPFWKYKCLDHAPIDKERYAMVEIDNRTFSDGKRGDKNDGDKPKLNRGCRSILNSKPHR
jgi:hypothetical protein